MRIAAAFLAILPSLAVAQAQFTPQQSLARMKLPPGFNATLFAAEPDVRQPIGFSIDGRGRLWVLENYSYPKWTPGKGKDRILVLEDTDGDGRHDRRTVFYEGFNYATGIEAGFGGVFVVSAPNLYFIPDRNNDLKPDADPEVLLDGFGHQGVHNLVNGLSFGPDGWLYAGHGGSSSGYIGHPSAPPPPPDAPFTPNPMNTAGKSTAARLPETPGRTFFDGGVWRYHPLTKTFESVMEGTTNPWGIDFDDYGQAFVSNSVTPHLYHVIPGSHVERRRQSLLSRHAYGVIPSIADHQHYAGSNWAASRAGANPAQPDLGGGHSHAGLLCYLGDAFPAEYRNTVFMNNIHGNRINNDRLSAKGSGYAASHGPDFLLADDPEYRGLTLRLGPDGSIFASDWHDRGECHQKNPDTTSGRIYRISFGDRKPAPIDVDALPDAELVELHLHRNDFFVRHARRVLMERGPIAGATKAALLDVLHTNADITRQLRALWTLHAADALEQQVLSDLFRHDREWLRAWSIRLAADRKLGPLPGDDPSPIVRLHLAGACRRIPPEQAWPILERLVQHADDAADANLPLMYWYALEPLVAADKARAIALMPKVKIPQIREFITRRLAAAAAAKN